MYSLLFQRQLSKKILKAMAAFATNSPPAHPAIEPLTWLLGKWKSDNGLGRYPTMEDFQYHEELDFTHVGQPNLQFSLYAFLPNGKPMHREIGFLRVKPGTNIVAFNSSHNTGLSGVEEGTIDNHRIFLQSHTLGRLSFGRPPATKKIQRTLTLLDDGRLEHVTSMETENTPLTEHLRIIYEKVSEKGK